ncbi:MAG TPA: DUF423 domain-containing protein [Salinimicrobium sp.]|nr:DUF423 domain-containing protein [Salinimicrobium sp.]
MNRKFFATGAFLGLIAIILGAFAAHGLKPKLTMDAMQSFETGVRYQMYSSLFLLLLGLIPMNSENNRKFCFYLTLTGVILFSGSIYLLSTQAVTSIDFSGIALTTPIGGALLISAWAVLLISVLKLKKK